MIFARKNNFQKNAKKFEKSFKKVLTKGKWCGNMKNSLLNPRVQNERNTSLNDVFLS